MVEVCAADVDQDVRHDHLTIQDSAGAGAVDLRQPVHDRFEEQAGGRVGDGVFLSLCRALTEPGFSAFVSSVKQQLTLAHSVNGFAHKRRVLLIRESSSRQNQIVSCHSRALERSISLYASCSSWNPSVWWLSWMRPLSWTAQNRSSPQSNPPWRPWGQRKADHDQYAQWFGQHVQQPLAHSRGVEQIQIHYSDIPIYAKIRSGRKTTPVEAD